MFFSLTLLIDAPLVEGYIKEPLARLGECVGKVREAGGEVAHPAGGDAMFEGSQGLLFTFGGSKDIPPEAVAADEEKEIRGREGGMLPMGACLGNKARQENTSGR